MNDRIRLQLVGAAALLFVMGCAAEVAGPEAEVGVTSAPLIEQLYWEGFEQTPSSVSWTGDCAITAAAASEGSAGLRCNDTATATFDVDAGGLSNLQLSYSLRIYSYETGESVWVQVSPDGSSWQTVDQLYSAASFTGRSVALDPSLDGTRLHVRFVTDAYGYFDRFDLDAIEVSGDSAPCDPSDPQCMPPADDCAGPYVATASEHVAAGRATATVERCGWFCRTTVYRAIGSGEVLAAQGGVKLFEEDPGSSHFTQQDCGATQHPAVPPGERLSIPLGEPFDFGTTGWEFESVAGTECRSGLPAGLAIRHGGSDNLVIYLEGGRACFDIGTCSDPYQPDRIEPDQELPVGSGILDAADPRNPVADWNMVYIPYCTGDVFAGSRPNGSVPLVSSPQQFVGYQNMRVFLARLAATFPAADQILLTGVSAGGFGAFANFHQAQQAFDGVGTVHVVDDSGPPMAAPQVAECLLDRFVTTWNLYGGALPDGLSLAESLQAFASWYPNSSGGLLSYKADEEIRMFWGYGLDDCGYFAQTPPLLPASDYEVGLHVVRDVYMPPSLGTYYANGTAHTFLGGSRFYVERPGIGSVAQWLQAVLNGSAPRLEE